MKKFIVGALSIIIAASAAGCGASTLNPGGSSGGNNDIQAGTYNTPSPTKTTIKVAAMAAGLGSQWLVNAAEEFAKEKAQTKYAEGKTGVYVELTQPTTGISAVFSGISNSGQHIVFTEQGNQVSGYIYQNKFLDITDVVRDTSREGGTIEDAMFSKHKEVFKKDDKYYALPHAEFYGGLAYNHDVFLEHNALFADDSCDDDFKIEYEGKYNTGNPVYFALSSEIGQAGCVLSAGPDGATGTEDDGLPCSVEEFMVLLDYFKNKGVAPIVLSGKYVNMLNYFLCGMWASLAGQAQMESYYSLNGEIEVVTGFTNENLIPGVDYVKKPVTQKVTITPANSYLGNSMAAKYYALAIAEMIDKEGFYLTEGVNSNTDHLNAQKILIYSSSQLARTTAKTAQTAMLMDGSYWINETTDGGNFDSYYLLGNTTVRPDIRNMALPTSVTNAEREAEDFVAAPSALMDINYGCCVINANVAGNDEIVNAAKDFLRFFYSEKQIKNYTRSARQFIALSYDFTDDELKDLDPFYQKLWKLRDNQNGSNIVYPSPRVGTDAASMATYRKAINTIYTQLQSSNWAPSTTKGSPISTSTPYMLYAHSQNKLVGDTYCYGSQNVFKWLEITQEDWHSVYNIAV